MLNQKVLNKKVLKENKYSKCNTEIIKVIKNICLSLFILMICLSLSGCKNDLSNNDNNKTNDEVINIVATNFPAYDFCRAITKDANDVELSMLLKPGVETHSFDPTPSDIIKIQSADIFVYVGGESDVWVEKILNSIDKSNIKVLKMSDYVSLTPVEFREGMQEEDEHEHHHEHEHHDDIEYDEHVWTSPINAIKIIEGFNEEIIKVDEKNKELYARNTRSYIDEIKELDNDFRKVVDESKIKELIFADRFPIIYFTKEYGLDYYAAFPGCSSESEVSAKTLSFLIDKVKEDNIRFVFYLEQSSKKVANSIKEQTGADALLFHSAHNVSKDEFEAMETYVSLMRGNIERLKKALN